MLVLHDQAYPLVRVCGRWLQEKQEPDESGQLLLSQRCAPSSSLPRALFSSYSFVASPIVCCTYSEQYITVRQHVRTAIYH
jgi:hypothetical protein